MKLMAKRDELLALFDLADRKGYDVTQSSMWAGSERIGRDGVCDGQHLISASMLLALLQSASARALSSLCRYAMERFAYASA